MPIYGSLPPALSPLPLPHLPLAKNTLQIIRYCTCDKPKLKSATQEEENVEQLEKWKWK